MAEVSRRTATPRSEAPAQTALPTPIPRAERLAARRPDRRALSTTIAVSGPGVTMSTVATKQYARSLASTPQLCSEPDRQELGDLGRAFTVVHSIAMAWPP